LGFFDDAAQAAKNVASSVVGGFGTPLTSSYRTSVLYDFSVIDKAAFFILEAEASGSITGNSITFKAVETLPVQINPTEIRMAQVKSSVAEVDKGLGLLADSNDFTLLGNPKNKYDNSLSLKLDFDVFDEYQVRSMKGMLPSDVSLCEENIVIIEKLIAYCNTQYYFALFKWGDIEYFGKIQNVDVEYGRFSIHGQPLKAVVTVEIGRQNLGTDSNGIEKKPSATTIGTAWNEAQGYAALDYSLTSAAQAAEQVANLTLPSLMRAKR
jgi:hypothetical protein